MWSGLIYCGKVFFLFWCGGGKFFVEECTVTFFFLLLLLSLGGRFRCEVGFSGGRVYEGGILCGFLERVRAGIGRTVLGVE